MEYYMKILESTYDQGSICDETRGGQHYIFD